MKTILSAIVAVCLPLVAFADPMVCVNPSGAGILPDCDADGALQVGITISSVSLPNDTFFTSVDAAGTGTSNLMKSNASDNTIINAPAGKDIIFTENNVTNFTMKSDADADNATLVLGATGSTAPVYVIRSTTADAADDGYVSLISYNNAGGITENGARGGGVRVCGNESACAGGIVIDAGNAAGSDIYLKTYNSAAMVYMAPGSSTKWEFRGDGTFWQDATNGGNIVFHKAATGIVSHASGFVRLPSWAVASKPATCTVGDIAVCTDCGANCATGSGSGRTCACTVTNTWN